MKALLWKDYHVNRVVLGVGAAVLALPYVLFGAASLWQRWRYGGPDPWPLVLVTAGVFSLGLSLLTLALLAGNAIAGERADRSAEFLAYLPVSRQRILLSKALLALAASLLVWVVNLAVLYGVDPFLDALPGPDGTLKRNEALPYLAAMAVLAFGLAWCTSSLLSSPAISACLGIALPIVLLVTFTVFQSAYSKQSEFVWDRQYETTCIVLGIVGFTVGTCSYLRRIEP
jgi:hypothetical protein